MTSVPDVTLRPLRRADVAGLLAELGPVVGSRYPDGAGWLEKRLARSLSPTAPGADPVVVTIAESLAFGAVVGVSVVVVVKARGVKLGCLWVAPQARRTGVARALVAAAVRVWGARALYLTAEESLQVTFDPLLGEHGFVGVGRLSTRYGPDRVDLVWERPADRDAPVRALSLSRPWGDLVLGAGKDVENRSRQLSYRGLLVIHAAMSANRDAAAFCSGIGVSAPAVAECPTGFIGVAHLVAVACARGVPGAPDCGAGGCSPWAMGRSWHWQLRAAVRFPAPIPGRGFVSLWTPPPEVVAAARRAVRS